MDVGSAEHCTFDLLRHEKLEVGVDEAELEALKKDAREKIEAAVAFAEVSPEPDVSAIMEGVYA